MHALPGRSVFGTQPEIAATQFHQIFLRELGRRFGVGLRDRVHHPPHRRAPIRAVLIPVLLHVRRFPRARSREIIRRADVPDVSAPGECAFPIALREHAARLLPCAPANRAHVYGIRGAPHIRLPAQSRAGPKHAVPRLERRHERILNRLRVIVEGFRGRLVSRHAVQGRQLARRLILEHRTEKQVSSVNDRIDKAEGHTTVLVVHVHQTVVGSVRRDPVGPAEPIEHVPIADDLLQDRAVIRLLHVGVGHVNEEVVVVEAGQFAPTRPALAFEIFQRSRIEDRLAAKADVIGDGPRRHERARGQRPIGVLLMARGEQQGVALFVGRDESGIQRHRIIANPKRGIRAAATGPNHGVPGDIRADFAHLGALGHTRFRNDIRRHLFQKGHVIRRQPGRPGMLDGGTGRDDEDGGTYHDHEFRDISHENPCVSRQQ